MLSGAAAAAAAAQVLRRMQRETVEPGGCVAASAAPADRLLVLVSGRARAQNAAGLPAARPGPLYYLGPG